MRILVVDDEALARARLLALLADSGEAVRVREAASAAEALAALGQESADAVLLDIGMPGQDGLSAAAALAALPAPPAVVFVTAHADHAVQAFDLEAVDYLTKPVRLARLQQTLAKLRRRPPAGQQGAAAADSLLIQDRGRAERVPLGEVRYLKAELKYVTVRTAQRSYILDASLADLESRYARQFLRVHRNALAARAALRALERSDDPDDGSEGWALRLDGVPERLQVSRRQLAAVREALAGG
ncbi:LytR/AlgR family response regulator transcription factor [Xylophilus sp.]|uniref:LytR/AlgR family response regulator transcription factor n=1 Tax=Xylophilus sp. TaxID=2653893 RepID=UPI002D80AB13|nr:LytTR family DNA-binding domain-containing protein [Xylophilus sp.]